MKLLALTAVLCALLFLQGCQVSVIVDIDQQSAADNSVYLPEPYI